MLGSMYNFGILTAVIIGATLALPMLNKSHQRWLAAEQSVPQSSNPHAQDQMWLTSGQCMTPMHREQVCFAMPLRRSILRDYKIAATDLLECHWSRPSHALLTSQS